MTDAPLTTKTSITKGIAVLPLHIVMLIAKRPVMCLFVVLLLLWGTVSGLALFSPVIAERFNNAAAYFGLATVASEASDIWRKKHKVEVIQNRKLRESLAVKETELKSSRAKISEVNKKNSLLRLDVKEQNTLLKSKSAKIDQLNSAIESKNVALRKGANELRNGAKVLRATNTDLKAKTQLLNGMNAKLTTFRQTGKRIESGIKKRFTKVAIFDVTGEFLGWIPVLGDAASFGLAAGGIYEMCQMFKEIERATSDLGVRYQVYSDTFCEKPAEKSAEIISETTKNVKDEIGDRMNYTKMYWSNKYKEYF